MQKNDLRQIQITDILKNLPDLKNSSDSKTSTITKWLIDWIEEDLSTGKIQTNNLIPSKSDFAFLLGVSIGTVQNAIRCVEDKGYLISKQCIGTLINDRQNGLTIRKLTSKRELTAENIKKYIKKHKIKVGTPLPSSRQLAKEIRSSQNTTRLALDSLHNEGILERNITNRQDSNWILKSTAFSNSTNINEQKTLVKKIEQDLKFYISDNLKIGSKLPSHNDLAQKFNVSIKTIHDALKLLTKEGILLPRRGRYGTSIIKMPNDKVLDAGKETSIFAAANETALYYYERTQNHIKRIISENYSIGDKLPSIMAFAKEMDLSPNTIRKAFQKLAEEGYLTFSRGRYGGTFVTDIPDNNTQTFKWLAVNPSYTQISSETKN